MIEDTIKEIIVKFNEKSASDEKLRGELAGVTRVIMISLDDGRRYHFTLADSKAGELQSGSVEKPDMNIQSSEQTIEAIYSGELRVMKALALRKVKVDGTMEDLLRLRKFF